MLDFHRNSVTAEVFAIGKEGFDRDALNIYTGRGTGVKVAESVNRATAAATSSPVDAASPARTSAGRLATRRTAAPKKATPVSIRKTATAKKATPTPKKATPASRVSNRRTATLKKATPSPKKGTPKATNSAMDVDASAMSPPSKNTASDASDYADSDSDGNSSGAHADSDNSSDTPFTLAAKKTARGTMQIGKIASPADSVKKRRRTASWKIGVNGPTIVAFSDDNGDKRSRKKYSRMVPGKCNFAISQLTKSSDMPLEKLIALWKEGITGIGQEFKDVYEFRDALQKYAIAHRFTYRVKKNDSTCVSCRCVAESCSWKIHAAWVSAAQSFRIKKFDNTHICEGQAHPAKNWLVNIIKDRLRDFPHQKPKEIVNGILRDFGIELTYTNVWRGIVDAREDIQGSCKEAYDQLPGLPCSHAIAVFNYSRKNLFEYCSEYYTVDRFRLTYSESINPVPVGSSPAEEGEASSDSVHVLPPCPARSLSHRRQDTPKEEDQLQEYPHDPTVGNVLIQGTRGFGDLRIPGHEAGQQSASLPCSFYTSFLSAPVQVLLYRAVQPHSKLNNTLCSSTVQRSLGVALMADLTKEVALVVPIPVASSLILNTSPLPSLYEAFVTVDGDERKHQLLPSISLPEISLTVSNQTALNRGGSLGGGHSDGCGYGTPQVGAIAEVDNAC
ncbi:hypothetical protein Acr_01g0006920 [Actinidia rufa]|uniref:Transposase MuDR plant domain-containing protein n=1 Tax=Actinidia rufa TaxID=165716 RepID=A0A7J0E2X8_9ERIC|nr:hypothetical protein Acr_01g0006920 [Actinidia rufa]